MLLFYDFETTGLPLWSEPSEHPDQPHIVQVAAAVVDPSTRQIVQSIDLIIHPLDWTIPEEMAQIHGITQEKAFALGIDERIAVSLLQQMASIAQTRGGHNESFDARIMQIAMMRYKFPEGEVEAFKQAPTFCTQLLATPICKCPPTEKMKAAGRHHHKSANLTEAYEFMTGKKMVNAHSAMADVLACMEVYFAILDRQKAA